MESAREQLLVKEKELTHAHDALAAERRRMPRMAIEKATSPTGKVRLLDVFEGRRQLVVYRFFFEPEWTAGPTVAAPGAPGSRTR